MIFGGMSWKNVSWPVKLLVIWVFVKAMAIAMKASAGLEETPHYYEMFDMAQWLILGAAVLLTVIQILRRILFRHS